MIDLLRGEWTKLRTVRWWLAVIIAAAAVTAAIAFLAGLALGAIAFPLHGHMLRSNGTAFYPLGTERGPHVQMGTLALFLGAGSFLVALGVIILCFWTLITLVLANLLARRRNA